MQNFATKMGRWLLITWYSEEWKYFVQNDLRFPSLSISSNLCISVFSFPSEINIFKSHYSFGCLEMRICFSKKRITFLNCFEIWYFKQKHSLHHFGGKQYIYTKKQTNKFLKLEKEIIILFFSILSSLKYLFRHLLRKSNYSLTDL